MKFLHLSDTHIHAIANNEELSKRLTYIRANYPEHRIILTGDVTDDGNENQYRNATKLFEPLLGMIYLDPGNHDYGKFGSFYEEEAAARFDGFGAAFGILRFIDKRPVVYQAENCLIILLNSNLETSDPFDFACGEIGRIQLEILKDVLESRSDLVKIVCLHHHPFIHGDPTMELNDAKEFLKLIHKRADVLLFGHKHEKGRWTNKAGITLVLASGATFQEPYTWEIEITQDKKIYSQEVSIL